MHFIAIFLRNIFTVRGYNKKVLSKSFLELFTFLQTFLLTYFFYVFMVKSGGHRGTVFKKSVERP